jgi:hypothetical protein
MTDLSRLPRPQLRSSDPQLVDELQQHSKRCEQAESVVRRRNDEFDFSSEFPAEVDPREAHVLGRLRDRLRYVQGIHTILAGTPTQEQFQMFCEDIRRRLEIASRFAKQQLDFVRKNNIAAIRAARQVAELQTIPKMQEDYANLLEINKTLRLTWYKMPIGTPFF